MFVKFNALFVLIVCVSLSANARDLYVNPRSEDPAVFKSITDAITNIKTTDVDPIVHIAPGLYSESVTLSKSVMLIGSGPDISIITPPEDKDGIVIQVNNIKVIGLGVIGGKNCINVSAGSEGRTISNCIFSNALNHGIFISGGTGKLYLQNVCSVNNAKNGLFEDVLSMGVYPLNCIFAYNDGNGLQTWGSSEDNITYCNFFNNTGGNLDRELSGVGNTEINPLFLNVDSGNYRLQQSSPLRDSGQLGLAYADPDGTRNDIGAYGGPNSAHFFVPATGGPYVKLLKASVGSVPQGGTIQIEAIGSVDNNSN